MMLPSTKKVRSKGENISKFEYGGDTAEEITKILSVRDDGGKAAVLLMASTGMRVEALHDLKLKHLKKWNLRGVLPYHVYQISVTPSLQMTNRQHSAPPKRPRQLMTILALEKGTVIIWMMITLVYL